MKLRKNQKYSLLVFLCAILGLVVESSGQSSNSKCSDWHDKIDASKPLILANLEHKTENEILSGMKCLLKLKGRKKDSNVAGASRGDVSEFFGPTSLEVAALYYVSYLFYERWGHSDAPFLLTRKSNDRNSDQAVSKAYRLYKDWFKKVQKVGIKEARKQNLDPLKDSDIYWY